MKTTEVFNGEVRIGDYVVSMKDGHYSYLVGIITNIEKLGSDHTTTENTTDDVFVDFTCFEELYPKSKIAEIEAYAGESYGEPQKYDDLPLDSVIMDPAVLIAIDRPQAEELAGMEMDDVEKCVDMMEYQPPLRRHIIVPNGIGMIDEIEATDEEDAIIKFADSMAPDMHAYFKAVLPSANAHNILNPDKVSRALKCLIDNGIETDECGVVLQALCYILCDEEIEEILDVVNGGKYAA